MKTGKRADRGDFARHIRHWRTVRGLSQARMAESVGLSVRHYNFLENGKSNPSREVALTLAQSLQLSLRYSNALLTAAGYAPEYRKTELTSEELNHVRKALDCMLEKQEPYPGIVMNPIGNLIQSNLAAITVFSKFVPLETMEEYTNIYELFFSEFGFKPFIANWEELARHILGFVKQEVFELDAGNDAYRLLNRLEESAGFEANWQNHVEDSHDKPIFQINLKKNDLEISFITTYTSFGNPFDVSLQELRIECFYPADKKTEDFCEALAAAK